MKQKLIVIGNGMAGARMVEDLIKIAPDLYNITVIGAEPYGNYNRIMLSSVLAGEKELNETMINDRQWYESHGIELLAGSSAEKIHPAEREIELYDGRRLTYDKLVLATGSDPIILPVPGNELPGVVTFRDIADVDAMIRASETGQNAVIIGGGLLGLEAANGLLKRGMKVNIVHLMDTLMERQLDSEAAALLKLELERRGMTFIMPTQTEVILGEDKVTGIRFKDGHEVEADIVVMAVGIRPNTALAKDAGLSCERGLMVDDYLQTSDPHIWSVGECAQHRRIAYGLVAPLYEQCKVLAQRLAGDENATYSGSLICARLKVAGVELFSAGDFEGKEGCEFVTLRDIKRGIYKKLVLHDNRIEGAILYGEASDGPWYFDLMRKLEDVTDIRDTLLFGQAFSMGSGGATSEADQVAAMDDDAEICGCNGVSKKSIVDAIRQSNLSSLQEIRKYTKASSSCGSCTSKVEALLANTLGDEYDPSAVKIPAMCPCADYGHDEVRHLIAQQPLTDMPGAMALLGWKTPDGCQKCRPALNFYLLCAWPGIYQDEGRNRFVNERMHANIQKDGTYSVIPRIWGGVTTARELKAIAEVAERYAVPTVKFTGGQRIDLLGIKRKDLPAVWKDLNAAGLVSGHAYGKALRTVKTCVGKEWCRFGTQDSTTMGIELERMTWGSWGPHKMKLAVSGCPRNCSESTIKDFGVIAVESGWDLYVGGNGGIKVRACDFLCHVKTDPEVLEYCGAFLQLYREGARYLERTAPWLERVGLDYIKQRVVEDDPLRLELYQRFLHAQSFAQTDPWAECVRDTKSMAFASLKTEDVPA